MADFRGKLTRFFMGRYARNDALYSALLIFVLVALFVGAALSVVGAGTSLPGFRIAGAILYVLWVGAMVWSVCRFLSRNIAARQRENAAWLGFLSKVKSPFCNCKRTPRPADTETHVFRACPARQASIPSAVPDAGRASVCGSGDLPTASRGVRTAGMPAYNLYVNNGRLCGESLKPARLPLPGYPGGGNRFCCPVRTPYARKMFKNI